MQSILIVVPAYNEEKNIPLLYVELKKVFAPLRDTYTFEILFINDGSCDNTLGEIEKLAEIDESVKYLDFSRNFGKEVASTAGLNNCQADACLMIDSDLQHPVELIPQFLEKWQAGAEVVIGIRKKNKSDSILKRLGSAFFYKVINRISDVEVVPNATDFRLLDKKVVVEFNRFSETNRMTRALIDWLGFRREYLYFEANDRVNGTASYSFWKLFGLAMNSFVSLSLMPLKLAGYLGVVITLVAGVSGAYILLGKYFLHLPLASTFSDSENLAILILFLVGIMLTSIGLISFYVANIHTEVIRRPMYVTRKRKL
jgi:polyisoprenyl-phosphate glycosyltransferase